MKNQLGFIFLSLFGALSAGCEPKAKLTIRMVDDAGRPVVGANVRVQFERFDNPNDRTTISGKSDSKGEFAAEGRTSGYAVYGADLVNYYPSRGTWKSEFAPEDGKWLPWNPTINLIMRPVLNPIPLLEREVQLRGVENSGSASFDVVEGDWLPPLGRGTIEDLQFQWRGEWKGIHDRESELMLTFAGAADGIVEQPYSFDQGSELRLVHSAPLDGYLSQRSWSMIFKNPPVYAVRSVTNDVRDDVGYFFRVRTRTNDSGEILSALYGKIEGDIVFFGAGKEGSGLRFSYFLNPTPNDRNLEFDGKTNLFDLRVDATVGGAR